MQVPRVLFEHLERNVLQRGGVSGSQLDRRCGASLVGFLPTQRAQAPTVAGLQAGETEFGPRRAQVVPLRLREGQKICGDFDADGMQSDVFFAGVAALPVLQQPSR